MWSKSGAGQKVRTTMLKVVDPYAGSVRECDPRSVVRPTSQFERTPARGIRDQRLRGTAERWSYLNRRIARGQPIRALRSECESRPVGRPNWRLLIHGRVGRDRK